MNKNYELSLEESEKVADLYEKGLISDEKALEYCSVFMDNMFGTDNFLGDLFKVFGIKPNFDKGGNII